MPCISLQEKAEEHRCFSNIAVYFYMNLQTLKMNILLLNSVTYTFRGTIFWILFGLSLSKNYKRLVSWPSARAIIWVFLSPTMFTIVPYATPTVHAQFLPILLVRSIHTVNYHFSQHLVLLKRQHNNTLEMPLSVKTLFFITTWKANCLCIEEEWHTVALGARRRNLYQ